MLKNIVVMPTFRRTEMLALSLQRLSAADSDLDVRIYQDSCDEKRLDDVEYVRDLYYPSAQIYVAHPHVSAPSGAWNILNSLKQGYESGADRIFLLEEDVLVYPGYFEWSLQQHWAFATCGRRVARHSSDYYTNPGASFRSTNLACIIPHICAEFFADRRAYLDRTFGEMCDASDLDDGLIRRVIRQQNGFVAYPEKPLVSHIGWQYYNKLDIYKNDGTIQERIENLRAMMKQIKPADRYCGDFEPYEG